MFLRCLPTAWTGRARYIYGLVATSSDVQFTEFAEGAVELGLGQPAPELFEVPVCVATLIRQNHERERSTLRLYRRLMHHCEGNIHRTPVGESVTTGHRLTLLVYVLTTVFRVLSTLTSGALSPGRCLCLSCAGKIFRRRCFNRGVVFP